MLPLLDNVLKVSLAQSEQPAHRVPLGFTNLRHAATRVPGDFVFGTCLVYPWMGPLNVVQYIGEHECNQREVFRLVRVFVGDSTLGD